jgi:O-antigen ligase
MHPNMQAANLAMGSIAAWVMAKVNPKAKTFFLGWFCVLFLFLILTKCRSATGTVPVVLGAIWIASQPSRNVFFGLLASFWLAASIGLICMVAGFDPIAEYQEVLLMGRGEETGSSLTGRLPLWQDLSEHISRKPWKGHGYRAFWTPRHIYEIAVSQEWVISEAHSSFMDVTLQLGLLGCTLFTITKICTLSFAAITFRFTKQPEYMFLFGGVFFCFVRSFTESGLGGPNAPSAFLFLALAAHSWNGPPSLIDTDDKRKH